jgi:DNA-directed RNA polymerase subunit beta
MEYSKFVELKGKLVEKLFLIVVELSGCHEWFGGFKVKIHSSFYAVEDFAHVAKGQWVADDSTNKMVNEFITIKKLGWMIYKGALEEVYNFCWGYQLEFLK